MAWRRPLRVHNSITFFGMAMTISRKEITALLTARISKDLAALKRNWELSVPVHHIIIDDLLPQELARQVSQGMPRLEMMKRAETIRERKYTSAHYADWGAATRETFLALQDAEVLALFTQITGIKELVGDPSAYAGGVSTMQAGDFLNPHLDNSSHPRITGYRRLNALYYVTPQWQRENGGNLELWPPQMEQRVEIVSAFNRLVLMNTDRRSLHSVNKVVIADQQRFCLSNYYFTSASPDGTSYAHTTCFRGRPGELVKDLVLRTEGLLKSKVQAFLGKPL